MKIVASCARCGAESVAVADNGDTIRFEHDCPRKLFGTPTDRAVRKLTGSKPVARIKMTFGSSRRAY